jgi:predicted site-specific integrase-resolvase
MSEKHFYTAPELAKRWRVSPVKVRSWIKSGQLESFNTSDADKTRFRISEEAVQKFEAARSQSSTTKAPRRKRSERTTPKSYV